MFEYLDLYRNSLSEDTEIEYVEELIKYYENNREGLLPYQSQGLELPKNPDGRSTEIWESWKTTSGV